MACAPRLDRSAKDSENSAAWAECVLSAYCGLTVRFLRGGASNQYSGRFEVKKLEAGQFRCGIIQSLRLLAGAVRSRVNVISIIIKSDKSKREVEEIPGFPTLVSSGY
jgi:hypothetical protein